MSRPKRPRHTAALSGAVVTLFGMGCGESGSRFDFEALPRWTLEPELRIGSVDDPDFAFTFVDALEVGSDGSIYSVHEQEAVVRRWTPDGRPAGTLGGRGEGPGEFTSPRALGWRGDSLWVLDGRAYRFSFFGAEGGFLRSVAPRVDLGTRELAQERVGPPRPTALMADGTLYSVTPAFSRDIVEGRLTRLVHVRASVDGTMLDTLAVVPVGSESAFGVILPDGLGVFGQQPFTDGIESVLLRDGSGLLVLERGAAQEDGPAEFRLTRMGLIGDTVFSRAYPYEPFPLPRERVDSAIDARAESLHSFVGERTGTTLAQWRGWVGDATYAPPYYPPVSEILSGRDGTVWLGLNPPGPDGREWLVLDGAGDRVGKVLVPAGLRVLLAGEENVWGVETDELDVQYIVRYAVVMP